MISNDYIVKTNKSANSYNFSEWEERTQKDRRKKVKHDRANRDNKRKWEEGKGFNF
jgi:hypothetical protein